MNYDEILLFTRHVALKLAIAHRTRVRHGHYYCAQIDRKSKRKGNCEAFHSASRIVSRRRPTGVHKQNRPPPAT